MGLRWFLCLAPLGWLLTMSIFLYQLPLEDRAVIRHFSGIEFPPIVAR